MMKKLLAAVMAVSVLAFAAPVLAQDGNMTRSYSMTPLPGHDAELSAAIASHVQWRKDNNDPWGWSVFQQAAGDDLSTWYVRSPGHTWADFDAYRDSEFSQAAFGHFSTTVQPHVGSITSGVSEFIPELSNWPDETEFNLVQVISYELKQGQEQAFRAAAQAITDVLKAAEWNEEWAFIESLTGPTPGYALVIPEANWAGFAPGEATVFDILVEATDPETATKMFADYSATVRKAKSTFYGKNSDLSYAAAE